MTTAVDTARRIGLTPWRSLLALGIGSELMYAGYFLTQFPLLQYYHHDTDMGIITGHSHLGFFLYLAAVTLLFAAFVAAWKIATKLEGNQALVLILGFGVIFAITLVFVYPITATDLFSYIAQSQVLVHYHHNPIFTPPATFPRDPLMALSDGYQHYGSPYGPLGILLDAVPSVIFGNRLLANLLLLKVMFSAMAVGSAYLVYLILRMLQPRLAISGALLIAWNPLILLEVSVNGHNDIAMMFLGLLAILLLLQNHLLVAPILLSAASMVKYATILLLPLFLLYGFTRQSKAEDRFTYIASALAWSGAVVAVLYAPFWGGTSTISALLTQNQRHVNSLNSILSSVSSGLLSVDQATIIGWVLFLLLYGYLLYRYFRDPTQFSTACFLVLLGFLGLAASNVETWYLLWPVMLAAMVAMPAARTAGVLVSFGTVLSGVVFGYIWVWLNFDAGLIGVLNAATYGLAFVPAAIVLVTILDTTAAAPSSVA